MRKSKLIIGTLTVLAMIASTTALSGQSSSINTYSPYTFYGLGDLHTPGTTILRSMGGAGVGFRSPYMINYLNPASYGAVRQESFLFNFGMEGQNFYEKSAQSKTSFNTFNVRDVAIEFPITKGVGFAFSVTPYSSVGYNVQRVDESTEVEGSVGSVSYVYSGSGGVNQYKAGLGWQVNKWLAVGADAILYGGSISRSFNTVLTNITGSGDYINLYGQANEKVSHVFGHFGIQATPLANTKHVLTIGATYQMGGRMNNRVERYIPTGGVVTDTVQLKRYRSNFEMPATYSIGAYYHRQRYSIGVDYVFSDWGRRNGKDVTAQYSFRNTSTVKVGGQYTPNNNDVRRFWNRWSYRAGFRYSQYYMVVNGQNIDDKAITIGLGIPVNYSGVSNIDLGAEVGRRGSTANGLVRDSYFKFSIGISIFNEDYWFFKMKYD